jgi:hypothetical protein
MTATACYDRNCVNGVCNVRVTVAGLVSVFVFVSTIAGGGAMAEMVSFDSFSAGALPAQWVCGVTGSGGSRWTVEADAKAPSKPNVVRLMGTSSARKNDRKYQVSARERTLDSGHASRLCTVLGLPQRGFICS